MSYVTCSVLFPTVRAPRPSNVMCCKITGLYVCSQKKKTDCMYKETKSTMSETKTKCHTYCLWLLTKTPNHRLGINIHTRGDGGHYPRSSLIQEYKLKRSSLYCVLFAFPSDVRGRKIELSTAWFERERAASSSLLSSTGPLAGAFGICSANQDIRYICALMFLF